MAEGGTHRTRWQRLTEPFVDRAAPPDVLRRNRLTGRFTFLNFLANIAFLLNDTLVVQDPRIIVIDLLMVPFYAWLHWYYVRSGNQRTTALLLLASLNGWLFFNSSYYGEDGLIFLFLYTLILMTFFLIDHRERLRMALFMAFPVIGLIILEATHYAWFTYAHLTVEMVEQTRLLSMTTNLVLLYIFMDGIVRNTVDSERRLLDRQQRLHAMADRLQELNDLKENYNQALQTRLSAALAEVLQKERALDQASLEGEERERTRIAQELHDGVGALLTSLKIRLGDFRELIAEEKRQDFVRAMELIDGAYEEVRQASHQMQPLLMGEIGLVNVLEDLLDRLNANDQVRVQLLHADYIEKLPVEAERSFYRVVTELLNNALRHAQADRIIIQLMSRDGHAVLTMEDNGRGYDPEKIIPGLGLKGIQHRVAVMQGTLHVETAPGRGVMTIVEVPLNPGP